ncbi:hypothetical protein CNEO3_220040 [Clostridium neonatale]|nr:hypothetical protein CNEO3_220040 [Clostridium neonatale]
MYRLIHLLISFLLFKLIIILKSILLKTYTNNNIYDSFIILLHII